VAHDAVRDEVAGFGRDVVEAHRLPERLDRHDAQLRIALDGLALDIQLARDRGTEGMEEAQVLAQAAHEAHDIDRLAILVGLMLDHEAEAEHPQAPLDPADDFRIGVGDAKCRLAEATPGVEDSREKARRPIPQGQVRPCDQLVDRAKMVDGARADRVHLAPAAAGGLEAEFAGGDIPIEQELLRLQERLGIRGGEPKLVKPAFPSIRAAIYVLPEVCIPANDSAQVPAPVIVRGPDRLRELAGAHQLVGERQVRPLQGPLLRADDVPPPPVRKKPVIAARDELGSVLERDPERALDGAPMGEHARLHVAPIEAVAARSVYLVPRPQLGQGQRSAIGHQDRRAAP
jgi:hypothetical protein